MTHDDPLLTLLGRHDPAGPGTALLDDDARLLARARTKVDARTSGAPALARPRRRLRSLVTVAAVATALPVAAVVLAPALTSSTGGSPLVGTAVASEGGLTCGQGHAAAVRPDSADPRPWPQQQPDGWAVRHVFARQTTVTGWCTTPSLIAAAVDAEGRVTGAVQVTGPARGIEVDSDGGTTQDRVGPYRAQRLLPGADAPVDAHEAWVLTDDRGEQWYATTDGWSVDDARELLGGLRLVDRSVVWDATAAPELQVLHQRTGAPYPLRATGQDWYVRFADGRELEARSGRAGETPYVAAVVGNRLTTVDGRPAVLHERDGKPVSVLSELRPGVLLFLEVDDDLPDVVQVLASVVDLPADDPRLDDLALPERYER